MAVGVSSAGFEFDGGHRRYLLCIAGVQLGSAEVEPVGEQPYPVPAQRLHAPVADTSSLDPVTVKSFLAFGMLLNNVAALDVDELDEPWAKGVRTRIHAGLFEHITTDTNR
ncbi:MAG TPA: hypothetical protein VEL02_03150 [Jatrophihabitantaceae bacterium]|nr:hypothetical protein [Jatrophihabitantaceae bacterium]